MKLKFLSSDAASGWAGWALAHPEFWSSVNPIPTRGTDYAHHITARPPRFENLTASLRTMLETFQSQNQTLQLHCSYLNHKSYKPGSIILGETQILHVCLQ